MYPMMFYKSPGNQVLPGGQSYGYLSINSDEEADAAVADGWFPTVPEALAGKLNEPTAPEAEPVDDSPPTREELEAKAKELGVKFSKKTSDAELGEAIAAKLVV